LRDARPHLDLTKKQKSRLQQYQHGAVNNPASAAAFVRCLALLTNDYRSIIMIEAFCKENGWIFIENQEK
jgi:hypothetical protein